MNEQDVRQMLQRRAGDATTSPDAWERIAERIDGDTQEATVVELAPRRARFNRPVLLGSIAAAMLLVMASVAVIQDREDSESLRATNPSPSPSKDPEREAGPPSPENPRQVNAETAARRWIRALAAGDGDVAWDLLAEGSREAAGGRSGFESRLTDLAEGWGAWDAAPQASYRAVTLMGGTGVVLVSGRVSQEGTTATRTMSLPVRFTADKAQVDPFSDVAIELDPDPDRGARVTSASVLGAYTPGAAKVWFILDEREPAAPDMSEDADGDLQHVTIDPDPALAPGQHSLTVVVLTVDGRVASRSTTFSVT